MPSLQYKIFSRYISILPLKHRLNLLFFRRFQRFISFDEPKTFNEKIQLRKVHDRRELLTIAADKLASKEYVEKICPDLYIPKTLWATNNAEDLKKIDFNKLPDNYVFKANHTSQTIEIIRNGNHLSAEKMFKRAADWFKHDQSSSLGEWAYKNIVPHVFIEEYLDFNNESPDDYKFFVYHGKVHFIQVDYDRFKDHKRNMYDANWNDLGFEYSYKRKLPIPQKPFFLAEMISIAEKLSQEFDFVRVDLYFYKEKVTFGELTIYPGAGFEKFPEKHWDVKFGSPWREY